MDHVSSGHHFEKRMSTGESAMPGVEIRVKNRSWRSTASAPLLPIAPNPSGRPSLLVYNRVTSPQITSGEQDDSMNGLEESASPPAHVAHGINSTSSPSTGCTTIPVPNTESGHVQYQISKSENGHVAYRVLPLPVDIHIPHSPILPHHHHASGHEAIVSPASIQLAGGQAAALLTPAHFHPHSVNGSPTDGGYYVMMTGQDAVAAARRKISSDPSSPHVFSPTDLSLSTGGGSRNGSAGNPRDEKRRATHNEVERRRRDKINNWISKLAKVVPGCTQEQTKQGQSKGGILAKTCDYIVDLERQVKNMNEVVKDRELLVNEVVSLQQQLDEARADNRRLCLQLKQEQGQQVLRHHHHHQDSPFPDNHDPDNQTKITN